MDVYPKKKENKQQKQAERIYGTGTHIFGFQRLETSYNETKRLIGCEVPVGEIIMWGVTVIVGVI